MDPNVSKILENEFENVAREEQSGIEGDAVLIRDDANAPSDDQSFVVLPTLRNNSEDIQNENHLMCARIVDPVLWEQQLAEFHELSHTQKTCIINPDSSDAASTSIVDNDEPPKCESKEDKREELGKDKYTWIPNDTDRCMNSNLESETECLTENSMSEPYIVHVLAEWPSTNTDFELLTKLDDEFSSNDPFCASHRASDIFDPEDWFVHPPLSDDDVPPGCRLRPNPGQFCLTPIESWTSCKSNLTLPTTLVKEPKH